MELTLITKCCELNEHSAYKGYVCWQIHYNHNYHYKMGTRLQWNIIIITKYVVLSDWLLWKVKGRG